MHVYGRRIKMSMMEEEEGENADEEKDTLWVYNFGFFGNKICQTVRGEIFFFLSILF
jgi:hypothetical protein